MKNNRGRLTEMELARLAEQVAQILTALQGRDFNPELAHRVGNASQHLGNAFDELAGITPQHELPEVPDFSGNLTEFPLLPLEAYKVPYMEIPENPTRDLLGKFSLDDLLATFQVPKFEIVAHPDTGEIWVKNKDGDWVHSDGRIIPVDSEEADPLNQRLEMIKKLPKK